MVAANGVGLGHRWSDGDGGDGCDKADDDDGDGGDGEYHEDGDVGAGELYRKLSKENSKEIWKGFLGEHWKQI